MISLLKTVCGNSLGEKSLKSTILHCNNRKVICTEQFFCINKTLYGKLK